MSADQGVRPFAPAKDATRAGRSGWLGILVAVLVVVLGVLCVREALVADGRIDARPWLAPAVDQLHGLAPSLALAALGVVVGLVGLWLVVLAFGRRRRTRLEVGAPGADRTAGSGVTIGVADAARLARVAALDVDDVLDAHASATRRTVTVTITAPEGVDVGGDVRAAVGRQLAPLADPMSIKIVSKVSTALRAGGVGA